MNNMPFDPTDTSTNHDYSSTREVSDPVGHRVDGPDTSGGERDRLWVRRASARAGLTVGGLIGAFSCWDAARDAGMFGGNPLAAIIDGSRVFGISLLIWGGVTYLIARWVNKRRLMKNPALSHSYEGPLSSTARTGLVLAIGAAVIVLSLIGASSGSGTSTYTGGGSASSSSQVTRDDLLAEINSSSQWQTQLPKWCDYTSYPDYESMVSSMGSTMFGALQAQAKDRGATLAPDVTATWLTRVLKSQIDSYC